MKKTVLVSVFLLGLCPLLVAQVTGQSEMNDVISQYQADQGALERKYNIRESDEFYQRFGQLYKDWLAHLKTLPFETMSQTGKVDYILLRNKIERDEYQMQQEVQLFQQIKPAIQFRKEIMELMQRRRSGIRLDGEQTAALLNQWAVDIRQRQTELEKLPKWGVLETKKAVKAVVGYQNALEDLYKFYSPFDAQFGWWTARPFEEADTALARYARFIGWSMTSNTAKDDGSGIKGNPIGRDELIRNLTFAMIPYTPEELIELANKEFAWCETEMLKATREMGLGNNWKAALEKVKNDHVEPGKQPEFINFLALEATDFVAQNNLVTVPPLARETWRMVMLTAEQQEYSPFFLGGELLMIAYPTQSMKHDNKLMSMRGNNKHFARATVFHEVIPGHHLQQFMNERYNTQRGAFYTPFWMEGWALYWEMVLWDKNFPKSPEDKVGMLFWRMHRCARIIFSLNYHLGKWTPQQCIDMLVDQVGHERANATAEVRRSFQGGYGPLYQLAYMIGAKQFDALRKELVNGGKMKEKDFHDAVLQNGPIPVEMVRAQLIQQPLTRDFRTSWKFIP